MTFQNELERERRRKAEGEHSTEPDTPPTARNRKKQSADVGDALRTVYERAVAEDIPPEMLDLLGKLG
ncbi:MAG: hypothetical protein JWL74_255 [Alphaproteobacteria bacterium]|nr:hypothetical protein [Alphaproteobacteria bacterium]